MTRDHSPKRLGDKAFRTFAAALAFFSAASFTLAETAPIGDRLVVAVNGVGYTQRQAESYVVVKESLRKTADGSARVVDERNWAQALSVFAEDMIVLQEAERLGSFQNEQQLIDKYTAAIRQKMQSGKALADTMMRLGAPTPESPAVRRTIELVLRVAAFRRSKDRQAPEAKDAEAEVAPRPSGARPKWLDELASRAVVRQYQDAERWLVIQPTGG